MVAGGFNSRPPATANVLPRRKEAATPHAGARGPAQGPTWAAGGADVPQAAPYVSRGVLHPRQDVLGHADELARLVDDVDFAARAPLDGVDLDDGVGERDGVADIDGGKEAHLVVAK